MRIVGSFIAHGIVWLAVPAKICHTASGLGVACMRKILTVLIALSLASALGACSKCDIAGVGPNMCRSGPGTGGT